MTIIDRSTFYVGSRAGILLIHGLGGTPVEMRYIAQGLHREGHTVHCCQLSGHCGSPNDLKKSTYQDWINTVEQALEKLQHCSTVFVGGLSAGSLLALYLAEKYPEKIDACMLYSPTLVLDGWAMPFYMPWLHYLRPSMLLFDMMLKERHPHGIKDERIRNMVVNSMSNNSTEAGTFYTPLATVAQFNALSAKTRKGLSNIRVPLVSFHSREDDFASISNSEEIIKSVSGKAELVVLDDSYHIIVLDKQRSYVLYKSQQFINSILDMKREEQEKRIVQYRPRSITDSV
jgi:carboxylesterase